MAEFNRTSLDIMDEIYAPFKAAQAQKHGLERQAGGASLARELQLRDAYTKRQQQLTDATTKRQYQVEDATTAHTRGQEDITHLVDEQARAAEDTAARLKREKLVERREEAAFLWKKLDKAGINPGFTITEINNATSGALAAMTAGMHLEVNTLTASNKTRTEILEKLKSYERTEAGRIALQEALGTADPIDWEARGQESKAYLDDLFGDVHSKVELQKLVGTVGYTTYKRNKRIQMEALEDTGIMDFMMRRTGDDRSNAAKWLYALPGFGEQLLQSIKDDWAFGDQRPDKLEKVMGLLEAGDLTAASGYLENEGEAGNQPLIEGIVKWAAQEASDAQTKLQIKILSKQGALQKLTSVNREINDYIGRHPEVEGQPVEDFYSNEEWDAFQGRRRAVQGIQPQPLEPGDRGLEGATLFNEPPEGQPHRFVDPSGDVIPGQAGEPGLGMTPDEMYKEAERLYAVGPDQDLDKATELFNAYTNAGAIQGGGLSPAAVANFVDPDAAPPVQGQASVQGQPVQGLGRFDRDGDGILSPYEKLLKADEEEGLVSGRGARPFSEHTISATDAKGLGTKTLDYLFPKHRGIDQSDTGYSRAGAGDVAIEVGERIVDAWLYASGWKLLSKAPAALGRVRALVSKPSGVGVGAFGRTAGNPTARIHELANQPTIKDIAKALGGGAALKSFQEFIKNPANVRDAYKWVRETGWRYSHGATPKLVPKTHRLNFSPVKPPGTPIVPPAPTP